MESDIVIWSRVEKLSNTLWQKLDKINTGKFHSKIKKQSTQILIFTGVETDYCVLASALDAIHLGYYVIVVMDACASKKNGQTNARRIFERFPEQLWITSTNDLISYLQT